VTASIARANDRGIEELRPVVIETGRLLYPEGSALIKMGLT